MFDAPESEGASMNEQIAQQPPIKRKPVYRGGEPQKGETIYITDEDNYTTDDLIEEDEGSSTRHTRQVSIERTSRAPRTPAANREIMRVTRHAGPPPIQRTSRTTASHPQPQAKQKPVKQAQKHFHWLFYVGTGMLASFALWAIGNTALSWLQSEHDNSVYGYPRTYQLDANVGHQGISHFIVENLHGDIIVMEVHPSNLAETKVYQGPTFSGAGTDLQPATISFQDVNSDGKPDMIISVGNGRYILINTGSAFRPTVSSDKIIAQEVK
jgi:hypothetical protein